MTDAIQTSAGGPASPTQPAGLRAPAGDLHMSPQVAGAPSETMSPGLKRLLRIVPSPATEEEAVKQSEFFRLRARATKDLEEAEVELEALEDTGDLHPAARAHLTAALDRVRKALCTTLVMQLGDRRL